MNTETEHTRHEEILSPEETGVLLKGIEDGSVDTSDSQCSTAGEVSLYDYSDCERLARGTLPTLQIINSRIARRLRDTISELLNRPVEVELSHNQLKRFGVHVTTIPMPASLNLIRMRPFTGTVLLVPTNNLIYMIVDCFFGGTGIVPDNAPARDFTQVEQRIITLLLEQVFDAITYGWQPVLPVTAELIGQEQNPHFAAIASSGDRVIVNEYTISIGAEQATLQFVIPRVMFDPVEELLDSAPRNDQNESEGQLSRALRERIEDTNISLNATLTETTLKLGEVLNLTAGDVIPVVLPEQIVLKAVGIPLYIGRPGASRNRNAFEITGRARAGHGLNQHREKSQ